MKVVQGDVRAGANSRVPQPGGLQAAGRQEPVDQPSQPALLQLTPPLRINTFRVRLDKGHH
jgi:hypothetical protein